MGAEEKEIRSVLNHVNAGVPVIVKNEIVIRLQFNSYLILSPHIAHPTEEKNTRVKIVTG